MTLKTTLGSLEFESGQLVKVGMVRYNYMDGNGLLTLIREVGAHLAVHNSLLEELEWSSRRQGPGTSMGARNGDWYRACPVCGQLEKPNGDFTREAAGHKPDCRLGKALGRFDGRDPLSRLMEG